MMRRLALVAVFVLVSGARPAAAASCSISATNIAFGNYTLSTIQVTATLAVKCTADAFFYIGLGAGISPGATVTNRSMTGPSSALLGYKLFSDAGYTANWGDTSATGWITRIANGNGQVFTVYAQIPANEYGAAVGDYSDTVLATIGSPTGQFASATTNVGITATVAKVCSISAGPLAFGTYQAALLNSTSTISATCTGGTTYAIGLNAGTATGATVTNRSMTGPAGALLGYKLFSNSGRTINWGNTVGTDTVAGTGTGLVQALTVYGQIPAGQFLTPGNYADTITATLTF